MSANQDIIEYRLSGGRTNTTKSNSLGGDMSEDAAAVIQSSAPLNLFDHVTLDRMVTGEFHYMTLYINCKNSTEGLPSAKWWLDLDTLSDENEFAWSLDNVALQPAINQNTIFLDGSDDYVDLTNDGTLWSQSLTKFSFSFWVYVRTAVTPADNVKYMVDHGLTANQGFGCYINNSTPAFAFYTRETGGTFRIAAYSFGSTDDYLNKWKHVVCVFDNSLPSANVKVYVDGVLGGFTANITQALNLSALLTFSINAAGFRPHVNIKQFKWWTTTALTQADVTNLFAGNDSLVTTPNYNLPMDEGRGNPLDTISGTKVGTLTNGALWDNSLKTIRPSPHKYIYSPFKRYNGTSDFDATTSIAALQLLQFTVSAWFRTTKNYTVEGIIINKGGLNSDSAGENMNYGIWMTAAETIQAGFETGAGVDNYVTSPLTYNDGKWHFAVVTYDQVTLRLYIDGKEVANLATTSTPETNTKDLVLGRNSRASEMFFDGDIDEPRVWNNDVTAQEQADLYTFGTIPQTVNVVFENKFGDDNGSIIAQELPNITTEPLLASWNTVASEPSDPNLYIRDIQKCHASNTFSSSLPIQIRRRILPNSITDQENAKGNFILKGLLRRSNTDQGSGEGGSQTPNPVTNFKIGSVGDSDCTSMFNNVLGEMRTRAVDYFLFLGDQTYNGTSCWFDRFTSAELGKTYITIGNHDEDGGKRSTWEGQFSMPDGYKRVDIENVAIIIMDSESSFSVGSAQYNKIQEELQKASQDNNIDWIIVTIHRPFVSTDSDHPPNEGGKADIYLPLFTQYKVDLVLQGHNHNYQRSKLLKDNTSDHENPTVVTSGSTFTKGQGFVVVTCGLGGHDSGSSLYALDNTPSWQQYQQRTDNGFLEIEFSGTNNTILTGRLVNIDGEVMDTFTIS